ncbi:MAG: hypothetical protein RL213_1307 [Bacteroidota bacterium]|jgi:hypothetical protein
MQDGFTVLTTGDADEWDRCLSLLPESVRDIHFTAAYHRMYEANGDGSGRLFCFMDNGRVFLYPFLIRPVPEGLVPEECFDISSPYGYSGPLSSSEDSDFLAAADAALRSYCRSTRVVTEFIRFHPLVDNFRFMMQAVDLEVIHLRDYIAVKVAQSEEDQLTSYASRNRNTLRKAMREGVVVRSSDDFSVFVSLYLENMRQLNAAPMYFFSGAFFGHLEQLSRQGGCSLVAEHEGAAVGAAVFLYSGAYGHYYLASANPAGRALGAGNLLLHEGINRCRESGVRLVHLGGGLTGASDDPLLAFKKSFSPDTVPYYIGRRVHDEETCRRLVQEWEKRHPDLATKYAGQLQCYRQTS